MTDAVLDIQFDVITFGTDKKHNNVISIEGDCYKSSPHSITNYYYVNEMVNPNMLFSPSSGNIVDIRNDKIIYRVEGKIIDHKISGNILYYLYVDKSNSNRLVTYKTSVADEKLTIREKITQLIIYNSKIYLIDDKSRLLDLNGNVLVENLQIPRQRTFHYKDFAPNLLLMIAEYPDCRDITFITVDIENRREILKFKYTNKSVLFDHIFDRNYVYLSLNGHLYGSSEQVVRVDMETAEIVDMSPNKKEINKHMYTPMHRLLLSKENVLFIYQNGILVYNFNKKIYTRLKVKLWDGLPLRLSETTFAVRNKKGYGYYKLEDDKIIRVLDFDSQLSMLCPVDKKRYKKYDKIFSSTQFLTKNIKNLIMNFIF